jgi:hypothetical protein
MARYANQRGDAGGVEHEHDQRVDAHAKYLPARARDHAPCVDGGQQKIRISGAISRPVNTGAFYLNSERQRASAGSRMTVRHARVRRPISAAIVRSVTGGEPTVERVL